MPGSSSSKTSAATTCAHESRADARGNALSARRRRLFCTHAMPYGQSSSAPASDRTHQVMADTQHTHTGDCCGPAAPCWSSGLPSTTCAAPATPFHVSAFYLLERTATRGEPHVAGDKRGMHSSCTCRRECTFRFCTDSWHCRTTTSHYQRGGSKVEAATSHY